MAAYRREDDLRSPAGWLPVHRDQLRAQRSVSSMGSLLYPPTVVVIKSTVYTIWKSLRGTISNQYTGDNELRRKEISMMSYQKAIRGMHDRMREESEWQRVMI